MKQHKYRRKKVAIKCDGPYTTVSVVAATADSTTAVASSSVTSLPEPVIQTKTKAKPREMRTDVRQATATAGQVALADRLRKKYQYKELRQLLRDKLLPQHGTAAQMALTIVMSSSTAEIKRYFDAKHSQA